MNENVEIEIDGALGVYLKRCREAMGKSLSEVSNKTRANKEVLLSGHRLACLERGDCKISARPFELKLLALQYGVPYRDMAAVACGSAPPAGRATPESLADPDHQQAATMAAEIGRAGSEKRAAATDTDPPVSLFGRYGRDAALLRESNGRHAR